MTLIAIFLVFFIPLAIGVIGETLMVRWEERDIVYEFERYRKP